MRRWKRSTVATTKAVLLDTHVFLWSALEPERLSRTAARLLQSAGVALYLSVASVLGNLAQGKLAEATDFMLAGQMNALSISPLAITVAHVRALERLERNGHKDPFDRLIAAQAMVENLPLVTADPAFRQYAQVKVQW